MFYVEEWLKGVEKDQTTAGSIFFFKKVNDKLCMRHTAFSSK